jgi:hypothetical protein
VRHGGVEQPGWAFAHRSILEYLAADHVARLPDPVAPLERYLWVRQSDESEAWEPDAQELIPFVAGCMANPTPLFQRLVALDRDKPDALYIMARLAGRCLADVDDTRLTPALVDDILDRAEAAYHALGRTKTLALALRHAPGVWRLETRLQSATGVDRKTQLTLAGQLGPIAVTPTVLNAFTQALGDKNAHFESGDALGSLGPTAATPAILNALTTALCNPSFNYSVAEAIEGFWSVTTTSIIEARSPPCSTTLIG